MIKNIVTSLTITTIVSLVIAVIGQFIFSLDASKTFVSAFIIQILGFYIWNSIVQSILTYRITQEQTKQAEYFTQQGVEVTCAHCNAVNFIPVSMEQDNSFNCQSCDKQNSVYIDVTVAQKTDIVDKQSVTISPHIKDKLDAERKLQQG